MHVNVNFFTYLLGLMAISLVTPTFARQPLATRDMNAARTDSSEGLLNVYLDCNPCDRAFIRREIGFVNYVRDRSLAEVHLFVTDERTGSGGRLYTLSFIGQKMFDGRTLALTYTSHEGDSYDHVRGGPDRINQTRIVSLCPAHGRR